MIKLQPITTSNEEQYAFMEKLLVSAFPPEEYRELHCLREYTDGVKVYSNNLIIDHELPIGLFSYWDLEQFYYVEHFAIDPSQRNSGYGGKVIQHVCEVLNRPLILEVEAPTDEMSKRRINFYKRQGFELWENEYQQPPYRKGDDFLPMQLMAYGALQPEVDFAMVQKKIYREVYQLIE